MRRVASILGLTFATCLLGCELGRAPTAPKVREVSETPLDSRALLRASLTCMMAPILHDSWRSADDQSSTPSGVSQALAFDAEATSCFNAARAIEVRPVRLYRLDSDATFEVRRAIAQNRGDVYSSREVNEMMSVFDLGLAAVAEGRHAHAVLARKAPDLSTDDVDQIRAHRMVVALDDFGRTADSAMGVEARAIAALIVANDFLLVSHVRAAQRPFAAEPLFTMFFGSEFLSDRPDTAPAPWPEYVSAAARAIEPPPDTPAIGGGPSAPDEQASLRAVTSLVSAHLQSLAQQLPEGEIRSSIERTIGHYIAFDVEAALAPVGVSLPMGNTRRGEEHPEGSDFAASAR
jgi:hypothetical protein